MLPQRNVRSFSRKLGMCCTTCLLAGVILAASTQTGSALILDLPNRMQTAPNAPTYSYYLWPTSATTSTYEVKLTTSNCMGVAPPSAQWYGPSGQVSPTCSGGPNLIREYIYYVGSLTEVIDHFYISACNRIPGSYRVEVGWEYTGYFTITGPPPPVTSRFHLPLVTRALLPPGAFSKTSPADASELRPLSLSMDWTNSSRATSYAYCVDTSDDNACSNWVETGTTSQAYPEGLSEYTTYYWQVRAANSQGITYADGAETAYWSFTTGEASDWAQMTPEAEWSARRNHSSVTLPDGSIVLMGGSSTTRMNDVWRSTNMGDTWTQMTASAEWSARFAHTSVVLSDGSIVLMGGYDGGYKNDVWRSTDMGATWTALTASAEWSARWRHASVVLPDNSIVLMGGGTATLKNDVWRSTDMGATWTEVTPNAEWVARQNFSSVVLADGKIVLTGGNDSSYNYLNDVWLSNNQGATWTAMTASAEWTGRNNHASVVLSGGSILLLGGSGNDGYWNDTWQSTDQGASWLELTAAAWTARYAHTCVKLPDGSLVLMGGNDGSNRNDVWRLFIDGD